MKRHLPLFLVTTAIIIGSNLYYTSGRPLERVTFHHAAPMVRRYDDGVNCPAEAVLQKNMTGTSTGAIGEQTTCHQRRSIFRWVFGR